MVYNQNPTPYNPGEEAGWLEANNRKDTKQAKGG